MTFTFQKYIGLEDTVTGEGIGVFSWILSLAAK